MTLNRKRIVQILIVIVVIVALLLTMHILVNNFDLFGTLRSLHGG
ncbi:hypothetical protein [Candidatus Flexifilum breve]